MLRTLSFSRRRKSTKGGGRRSNADPPSKPPTEEGSSDAEPAPSDDEDITHEMPKDCEVPVGEWDGVDMGGALNGLTAKLMKRNRRGAWDKRFYEFNEQLGVLLAYSSGEDYQRKIPAHTFLCSDMRPAERYSSTACPHGWQLAFKSGTRPLCIACPSAAVAERWVHSLRQQAARAQSGSVATARLLKVRVPVTGSMRMGLDNLDGFPFGAVVDTIEPDSSFYEAGLRVDDAILSVRGTCGLSHKHTMRLLDESRGGGSDAAELVVWSQAQLAHERADPGGDDDAW